MTLCTAYELTRFQSWTPVNSFSKYLVSFTSPFSSTFLFYLSHSLFLAPSFGVSSCIWLHFTSFPSLKLHFLSVSLFRALFLSRSCFLGVSSFLLLSNHLCHSQFDSLERSRLRSARYFEMKAFIVVVNSCSIRSFKASGHLVWSVFDTRSSSLTQSDWMWGKEKEGAGLCKWNGGGGEESQENCQRSWVNRAYS